MNINLAINEGTKILKGKFIPNPILDAEILMAKTINKDRNYILLNSNDFINKNDLNNFFTLIEKRSLGKFKQIAQHFYSGLSEGPLLRRAILTSKSIDQIEQHIAYYFDRAQESV